MALGKLQIVPTVNKDDTEYAATGQATDAQLIRWVRGWPQTWGGWSKAGQNAVDGVPRNADTWTTSNGDTFAMVGTHKHLYAFDGARFWNITPVRKITEPAGADPFTTTAGGGAGQSVDVTVTDTAHGAIRGDTVYIGGATNFDNLSFGTTSGTLGSDPFSTTKNSKIVVVNETDHGLTTDDIVYFTGASAVGGITIGGSGSGSFGTDPYTTVEDTETVVVTLSSHGLFTGETVTISDGTAVNGITVSGDYVVTVTDANTFVITTDTKASASGGGGDTPSYSWVRPYTVYVIGDDNYLIMHPEAATSAASGGGASVAFVYRRQYEVVSVTDTNNYVISVPATGTQAGTTGGGSVADIEYEINIGLRDGIGGKGFGLGRYGEGGFGLNEPDEDIVEPRIWHLASRGDYGYANPLGGTIYEWTAILSRRAKALSNAPGKVLAMLVTEEFSIMAFGCDSVDGVYLPMVMRYSDQTNVNIWEPGIANLAGDIGPFGAGSFFVTCRLGRNGVMAWSNSAFFTFQYTTNIDQLYQSNIVGTGCGAIGPNAVVVDEGEAYWISRQRSFYVYRGGAPTHIDSPIRRFFEDGVAVGQEFKIYGTVDNYYHAVQWFYPTTQNGDNDKYIRWDILADPNGSLGWSNGNLDRTFWVDNVVLSNPLAGDSSGNLYFHESGTGNNGGPVTRRIKFAPFDAMDGDRVVNINRVVIGMSLTGTAEVTVRYRYWPQNNVITKGPFQVTESAEYPGTGSLVIDSMGQGRQVEIQVESSGNDNFWRVDVIRVDASSGPRR